MSKVVVVLGPGRSGTSLMMQLLHAAGLQLPYRLTLADTNSPIGGWEDVEILQLHRDTRREKPWHGFLPSRDGSVGAGEIERTKRMVRRIVQKRLDLAGDRSWGFKDPRTCFFLPIWNAVFDEFGIEPIFIHCFRSPPEFVRSFLRAYPTHPERRFASLIYFWRTYYGLKHTDLSGYVAHYEDWETDFLGQLNGVLSYCGLDLSKSRVTALRQIYQPKQPQRYDQQPAVEPIVMDLYQQLRACTGVLSHDSPLKSFIERVDQLLLQFGPVFDAMYASLDEGRTTKTLLREARKDAADLRAGNAILLQRLDSQAQIEWAEAVNEARRARASYEQARQALSAPRVSADDRDVYKDVGRKILKGVSRGPFHALAALADVYRKRKAVDKNGSQPVGGDGENRAALRKIN